MELIQFSDANFETEVLQSDVPVLVDFWATWCDPCKNIEPVIKDLADKYVGKLKVGKLNVEEAPQTAKRYMVRHMPTFMIFKNGTISNTQLGAVPKSQLMQFIEKAL
jgi:thioredoxin 1